MRMVFILLGIALAAYLIYILFLKPKKAIEVSEKSIYGEPFIDEDTISGGCVEKWQTSGPIKKSRCNSLDGIFTQTERRGLVRWGNCRHVVLVCP